VRKRERERERVFDEKKDKIENISPE